MDRDDRPLSDAAAGTGSAPGFPTRRRSLFAVACGLLVIGSAVTAGHLIGCLGRGPEDDPQPTGPTAVFSSKPLPQYLFRGWPDGKPDLAVVVTGQQYSYLKFCGCSAKQLGGLERRYNFIAKLTEKGWPVAAVDLGDLVLKQARGAPADQLLLKYETTMKSLQLMGYAAVGLGEHDFNLPLESGLSRFTLQKPEAYPRVVCANLSPESKQQFFPLDDQRSLIRDYTITGGTNGALKMGVVSVAGASLTYKDPNTQKSKIQAQELKFLDNGKVLPPVLQAFNAAGVELRVLLYLGSLNEAKELAGKIPGFHAIVCLSEEEEPSGDPTRVGDTLIFGVGHKARYVGVLGAYRTAKPGQPVQVYYQLAPLEEELETDADQEAQHPILALLDGYARRVRDDKYLERFPRNPHPFQSKAAFVGSDQCRDCHRPEYDKWKQTHHAHAYDDLARKAHKPSLRQYDGECVVCHTVGFEYTSGYQNENATPHLKDVGCENCHGPGSLHAKDQHNKQYLPALSRWKTKPDDLLIVNGQYNKAVLLRIDGLCQKCHDDDNDPNYSKDGNRFEGYWPKIAHGKSPQLRP